MLYYWREKKKRALIRACTSEPFQQEVTFLNRDFELLMKYIAFTKILKKIESCFSIDWKLVKWVLMDSEDDKILFILDLILSEVNYLTIITKRKDYFEEKIEQIYEEYGLWITIESFPLKEQSEGNFIIDLSEEGYRSYTFFKSNAIVISMIHNKEKMIYLEKRRKDLVVITNMKIGIKELHNTNIDNAMLGYELCKQFRQIKELSEGYYARGLLSIVKQILVTNHIEVEELSFYNKNL